MLDNTEISYEDVSSFIFANFQKVTIEKNQFRARCAICGDSVKSLSKKRFTLTYFSPHQVYWHCFNCDEGGKDFFSLYSKIKNITWFDAVKLYRKFDPEKIKKSFSKKPVVKVKDEVILKENFNYILDDCIRETDTPKGHKQTVLINKLINFKQSRHIENQIYVSYKGKFKDRIIIPVFENKNIVYFQGRSLHEKTLPKYLNPSFNKSGFIHNDEVHDKSLPIIITEGLIDALSVGNQGCCCFGASISDDLIKALLEKTDDNVIICLDNDVTGIKNTESIIDNSLYKHKILYFIMPDKFRHIKDMNEFKLQYTDINIVDFIKENSHNNFQAKVIYKLLK